jgi:3,4-dihydroxy 2-butanone 4-phosphate synthase/GTP cyclohydrolase II
MQEIKLNTIAEAILEIKAGRMVIVVDDEDRENEGDFVAAASTVTPEMINFMATEGRGLICAPLTEERCAELGLELMVRQNSATYETPFTVSVDLIGHGCTTGISASDRAKTVKALVDKNTKPEDLGKPGHIFPLRAKKEGVLRRAGHTEASVDLARLAGFEPAGVIVEIMNADGSMARLPDLMVLAEKFQLKIISIADLIAYRLQHEELVTHNISVDLPTEFGHFALHHFTETISGKEHLALVRGAWQADEPVLVRVHSSCVTGDIFHSARCDCGEQLARAMQMIEKAEKGVILYLHQEGRGIGLLNKLKAYKLQEQGLDTVDANLALGFKKDERDYGIGAQMLRALGVQNIRLLTNNPRKRIGLEGYGLHIVENVSLSIPANPHNEKYLDTKKNKLGHCL